MTTTYNKTDKGAYVALGIVFGLAAGMLLAPRSGEEMRTRLREGAMTAKRKFGQQLTEKGKTAMQAIGKSFEKSKNVAESVSSQAQGSSATDTSEQAQPTRRRGSTNG